VEHIDPIHTGHLILAETAYDKYSLDKVLLMPTAIPPHKTDITNHFTEVIW
jgi:nicotinate-nucleotide adenylyltransferase